MSQKEIDEIVSEFRGSTCDVSDELKNHCFRKAVNVVSLSGMIRKECGECAVCAL